MMTWKSLILTLTGLCLILVPPLAAQTGAEMPQKLVVGTKIAPPFAIKNQDGEWSGVSIDLWRELATELQWDFELRETDLAGLLAGLEDGSLDVAVAALTVTAEREQAFDFTHPFYTTGLGIAVPGSSSGGWMAVLTGFASLAFLQVLATLALVLLALGFLVWLFERRRNPQFGGGPLQGIGSGFWWSAVTMTTVGYGDKAPVTLGGRLVALIWMFAAIIIISSFTAAITSSLTLSELGSGIRGPEDLVRARVATVPESTSAAYLTRHRITHYPFAGPLEGLQAVATGQVDAAVYDAPMLKYLAANRMAGAVRVLPQTFERQDYAIGLATESPLREPLNRALLEKIAAPWWQETLFRYLGR